MKPTIGLTLFFFLLLFLTAPSCTIQKRLHRPGYNIQWKQHYRTEKASESEQEATDLSENMKVSEEILVTASDTTIIPSETGKQIEIAIQESDTKNQADTKAIEQHAEKPLISSAGILKSVLYKVTKLEKKPLNRHAKIIWKINKVLLIIGIIGLILSLVLAGVADGFLPFIVVLFYGLCLLIGLLINLSLGISSLAEIRRHPGEYRGAGNTVLGMFLPALIGLGIGLGLWLFVFV